MLVIKSVKVHGDTHKVLKLIKEQRRAKSMDEVVRELIRAPPGRASSSTPRRRRTRSSRRSSSDDAR